jgi:ketosteroid isomerase-like protein
MSFSNQSAQVRLAMSYSEGINENDPQRIIDMYADDCQFSILPSSLGWPSAKGKEVGAAMLKTLFSVMPKGKVINICGSSTLNELNVGWY